MAKELRILMLEDSPTDAELILRELRREGLEFTHVRVETEQDFEQQLRQFGPDLILSDYGLPTYNGLFALAAARQAHSEIPFILVSGELGEETAIDALKCGATDYVLKGRLSRLGPAARRALREAAERQQRRHAEQALRRNDEYFRALIENAMDLVSVLNADGTIRYESPAAQRILGYTPGELVGRSAFDFIHSDDRPRIQAVFRENITSNGTLAVEELRFQHKDGSWRTLEVVGHNLLHDPIIHGVIINSRDITERKALEAQFLRAQRIETIGRLASGIAHDLNNILTPILSLIPLLRQELTSPKLKRSLETLETSTWRGTALLKRLLVFARGEGGQHVPLAPRRLVEELGRIVQETFPKSITFRADLPADLARVTGDETQFHQVLLNLCVNARDAMPAGGVLTVRARNVPLDARVERFHPGVKAGPFVRFEVVDTGQGVPPEVLDKIFDPFFTTKEADKGTGLGLPTALAIVQHHGGFINVRSEVGKGSVFEVYLPAAPAPAEEPTPEPATTVASS